MKNIDIDIVGELLYHYSSCIKFINNEISEHEKEKAIARLNVDFIFLLDEIEKCKQLSDIDLKADRPITHYCYHCDLEELKDFF